MIIEVNPAGVLDEAQTKVAIRQRLDHGGNLSTFYMTNEVTFFLIGPQKFMVDTSDPCETCGSMSYEMPPTQGPAGPNKSRQLHFDEMCFK